MQIKNSVAFVTGGASGLGEATVRNLAASGGKVVILDRPNSKGAELASELGDNALFVSADVTSEAEVSAAIAKAVEKFGTIHANINCAGVGSAMTTIGKHGPFPLDIFKMTIEVNLIGTFNTLRLCAAQMAKNEPIDGERGVIVNTASVAAFDGQIGQAAYSASKGAIVGMTLPVARDLARYGIRVCTIAPGTFDTPLLALMPEPARQALAANIPCPSRLGHPSEFAALARHIVENTYLNAETIRLDGAIRMPPK